MSLFATEKVPEPLGITSVVSVNYTDRCISVRCSDVANGYQKLSWNTAFRALQSAKESGWINHSTIWASTPTTRQAAYAVPGDAEFGGTLRFNFPKGETSFYELVSKPVTATVFVDKSTGRFLNVSLKNRSEAAA
jgi:hypothetical protein